ncbi:hypothetical protein DL96DRAFT_1595988 [Flagelloscypha sp. PMI_526]|nr:hypothetical protein DL96DRAFT_1595988 [Flagelloscypha sp. PMI_526]
MEAVHNLPLDILRLLFEFSASASLETARTLSLVSKEVQRWADPHLFQVVQSTSDHSDLQIPRSSLLNQICMSDASPRLVLARHYVRAIAWREHVEETTHLQQALDNLPNLSQLCLWQNIFPFEPGKLKPNQLSEITQHYPALRRLATCLSERSCLPRSAFASPFWTTITHLQVNYYYAAISSGSSPFQLPLFTAMSSLTHLALLTKHPSREDDTFPPSLLLCLLNLVPPRDLERLGNSELLSTSRKIDERIVMVTFVDEDNSDEIIIVHSGDNFQDWCEVPDEVQTLWDKGEAILKRRREQTAVA